MFSVLSLRRRGSARCVAGALVALAVIAAPASAAKPSVRIAGLTQQVERGRQGFLDVNLRGQRRCRLESVQNNTARHTRLARVRGAGLRFAWTVPADAAAGPVSVIVRCARSSSALAFHSRTARTTITVVGDKSAAAGFLFDPRRVRISARAHRTGERIRHGLPSGVGDPAAYAVEGVDGTGGGGYGTFWPLTTGTRTQITQSQGGGVSHATTYTRYAVDLGVPAGTEIHAGFTGVVARVSNACRPGSFECGGGFGNYVLLKAADGTCALQAHLSRVDVSPGQQIPKYSLLGLSGYTGHVIPADARGAHLHYDRVVCATFRSLPWSPAEGGSLAQKTVVTSQNAPDPVCNVLLQGSCTNPQATASPQPATVNPQAPAPSSGSPTSGSGGGSSPTPAAPAPTPAPAQTWSETTGGAANTWTNYTNAGGTQGPTIPGNATVQIACRLTGFRVADGNTWWYRIASGPWNGAYYVSADAFYNNGHTSGSLVGTPFVDSAVATC